MENNQEKKKTPTDGMVGIRKALRDMGFSDQDIGYRQDTNRVTLKGVDLMTPEYLDDAAGVSYAKPSEIQRSLVKYYQTSGNPLVRVSDAYAKEAGKYGLSADALTYGNGTVMVGGKPVSVLYIDGEGKAWARQNAVAGAVQEYAQGLEAESPDALLGRYQRKYLTDAESILNRLANRKEFSYNPEEDPVFLAYRSKYLREGERASRDAVADMSTLTGGYASSAAVTAGAQARQYYAKQLTDKIPELAKDAFTRYMEKYQSDLDLAGEMLDLYDVAYQDALSANQQKVQNANSVAASNVERDKVARERTWEDIQNEQDYKATESEIAWAEILNPLKATGQQLSNQEKETFLNYYDRILQEELSQVDLKNREAEIFLKYYEQKLQKELW